MSPEDRRWLWLVYGTVLLPIVGQPLVVLASSALYFRWRRRWPRAAVRLNVHAWIAVGLNVALSVAAWRFSDREARRGALLRRERLARLRCGQSA